MSRAEKFLHNAGMRIETDPSAKLLVLKQGADSGSEGCRITRILQEKAADAVLNLITDSADLGCDHWTRLPHRLGHGEAKPFRQTLLNDDVSSPLQCVHDYRILVFVLHRKAREMHASP